MGSRARREAKRKVVKIMTGQCKAGAQAVGRWALLVTTLVASTAAAAGKPLAGRIWMPGEARFVAPATVLAAAERNDFVLLGETHSIARHHALQARLIRAAAGARRPALVFEMVRRDQQDAIERWRAGDPPAADAFGPAVGWQQRGWPAWSMYQPIIAAALEQDLPVHGGAPTAATLRAVARRGEQGLAAQRRRALGLTSPLPAPARARLDATLERAHCGQSEPASLARMALVQRLRDAVMAERLHSLAGADGAVLIAGRGHIRSDYGVPHYLAPRLEGQSLLSIAFMGAGGRTSPDERDGAALPFDFVWYTPGRAPVADCARSGH
jgi:uncharacterized iron-regulated protein